MVFYILSVSRMVWFRLDYLYGTVYYYTHVLLSTVRVTASCSWLLMRLVMLFSPEQTKRPLSVSLTLSSLSWSNTCLCPLLPATTVSLISPASGWLSVLLQRSWGNGTPNPEQASTTEENSFTVTWELVTLMEGGSAGQKEEKGCFHYVRGEHMHGFTTKRPCYHEYYQIWSWDVYTKILITLSYPQNDNTIMTILIIMQSSNTQRHWVCTQGTYIRQSV